MRGDARFTDFRTDHLSGLIGPVDKSVYFGVKLPKVGTGYVHTQTIRVRGLPAGARIYYYFPIVQQVWIGQAEHPSQQHTLLAVSARTVDGRLTASRV